MNERAAIGGGGAGVNVEMAYRIANEVMIDDKPAIADGARQVSELVRTGVRFAIHRLSLNDGHVAW